MTPAAPALREEALESWDHAVSDELVYFCDVPLFDFKGRSRFIGWPTEYKLGRAWLEVHLVLDLQGDTHYRAIIGAAPGKRLATIGWAGGEIDDCAVDRYRHVLVDVAKFIKSPERVPVKAIPSLVWLKRLDDFDCFTGDIPGDAPEPVLATLRAIAVNGEGGCTERGVAAQQGELPRKLIETGPQVVGELTEQQRDFTGDVLNMKPEDADSIFRLVLYRTGHGLKIKKHPDFIIKSLKVTFRPSNFTHRIC